MPDIDRNPDSGIVFGGSWWTVGNGAQVRLEQNPNESRWIEPSPDDLLAMLRAVGVDPVRERDVMDERVAKLEAECAELLDRLDRAGRVVDLMSLCHACQRNYEAAEAEAFGYGGERSEADR